MRSTRALLFAIFLAAVAACAEPERTSEAGDAPLVLGVSRIPEMLSPLSVQRSSEERLLAAMLFQGLFQSGVTAEGSPLLEFGLASSFPQPVSMDLTEFVLDLKSVRWHDGQALSPADVEYSWNAVTDPRNSYADRAALLMFIRSISGVGCSNCVRIALQQAATPEDLAWLLTFPISPHRLLVNGRSAQSPRVVHPDSAAGSAALVYLLRHPVGTGPFALEGSLGPEQPVAAMRRLAGGPGVVMRGMSGLSAQRAALAHSELDMLLEPDSVFVVAPPSTLRVLESRRQVSIALVLNPLRATLSSRERRQRVADLLRGALAGGAGHPCGQVGQRLPSETVHLITTETGPLLDAARARLKAAATCLGAALRVTRQSGNRAIAFSSRQDGMLVRLGDRMSDVADVVEPLLATKAIAGESAVRQYAEWGSTTSRGDREVVRGRVLQSLEGAGLVVPVAERRQSVLVSVNVTGVAFGTDGNLVGVGDWTWRPCVMLATCTLSP